MRDGLRARIVVHRSDGFELDVALSVPPGTTVALLGPNGAGKSTTVAALAGLLALDDGRIELAGVVLDDPGTHRFVAPEERRVGVVFQDHLLFPHMSVLENVAFGPRSRGAGRAQARLRAGRWIRTMELERMASRKPRQISGGQAQRVALARALATEPDLLLLDEPLSALDVTSRAALRRTLVEHLEAFEGPRLLITHDPLEAFHLADQIHVLEDGRITQKGTAEDIRMRPRTPYAADLAGSNLLMGTASGGSVDMGELSLAIPDVGASGPVRVSIRATAVSVHREPPGGSPRNRWPTVVERVEDHGSRIRLLTGAPLPLMVEVTPAARRELHLTPGVEVWLSVKATDIGIEPEALPGEETTTS
ncbi:MAG: ABC transporter ATP-binding protein [Longimicrobiales bacterium]|nr:ABC transporter ATP-binding protein [Longimicrobiales bacterium]